MDPQTQLSAADPAPRVWEASLRRHLSLRLSYDQPDGPCLAKKNTLCVLRAYCWREPCEVLAEVLQETNPNGHLSPALPSHLS